MQILTFMAIYKLSQISTIFLSRIFKAVKQFLFFLKEIAMHAREHKRTQVYTFLKLLFVVC